MLPGEAAGSVGKRRGREQKAQTSAQAAVPGTSYDKGIRRQEGVITGRKREEVPYRALVGKTKIAFDTGDPARRGLRSWLATDAGRAAAEA